MSSPIPEMNTRRGRRPRDTGAERRKATLAQKLAAMLLILGGAAAIVYLTQLQQFEAGIAARSIEWALGLNAQLEVGRAAITVGAGTPALFTLVMGLACSVVLLLLPFLLIAAAMLATGRATVLRAVPAVLIGSALLLAVNAVRMIVLAHLTWSDGMNGFGWAHTVYGSLVVLAGLVLVSLGFIWFTTRGKQARGATGQVTAA